MESDILDIQFVEALWSNKHPVGIGRGNGEDGRVVPGMCISALRIDRIVGDGSLH